MESIELQKPLAVANFVIEVAKKKGNPVTNLKLQKILFFLQGYFLSNYGAPLIDGSFSKWRYGPVEEKVYQSFKNYGATPINSEFKEASIDRGIIYVNPVRMNITELSDNLMSELKELVEKLINIEPWELVDITHRHSSWKNYEDEIHSFEAEDYTNEEIESCFIDNEKFLIGEENEK